MKWGINMHKLVNKVLFFIKIMLLLIDFVLTLYIMLMLNSMRDGELGNLILTCIPLLLILIIFVFGFFFRKGHDNLLFNVSTVLALVTILIINLRTLFDQNMVMWIKDNMNFYYFRNQIVLIKVLCYFIFFGNLCTIYSEYVKNKHT